MTTTGIITVDAEPYTFEFSPAACALLIIDMQRDFLEPGGFGEMLGNDVSLLRCTIEPNRRLLAAWRAKGWQVMHTREGHRPDLGCLPPAKKVRGRSPTTIGDPGPMGRILVRGEAGHDIIAELYPASGEPVIDKPGKGAFFATDLHAILQNRGIQQLVVTGVTTMRLDAGLDTGEMLLAQVCPIGQEETAMDVYECLAPIGADLMVETLRQLDCGESCPEKQNHGERQSPQSGAALPLADRSAPGPGRHRWRSSGAVSPPSRRRGLRGAGAASRADGPRRLPADPG